MKEKERERLGDRLITQIERRLLLSLDFGVWRFLLPYTHSFIHPYATNSRTEKRQRSVDDDFRRSSKALSLSGVSFVCLIDWESEKEREGSIGLLDQVSACSLAHSLVAFFSLLLLLRRRRRQRRQEMDALIGGWLAGWL